ncbi:MAG: hypothetical protein KAT68_10915 [Bacteroidales bacterium]|nr:hypothetical protein [Bacteroidales bacterium]
MNNLKTFRLYLILIIFSVFSSSCIKKKNTSQPDIIEKFIHISHTRTKSNPNIDPTIEKMSFSDFSMILLGGDLAALTSENIETMKHVDSIFNLGNANTLWSLGNHDYTDLQLIKSFTHRPTFYSVNKNNITFIILDTQESRSNICGEQLQLLKNIADTIKNSKYLIILHHKLIWMYNYNELEKLADSISNAEIGDCFYCINPNNFYKDVYPLLIKVKNKGIEVICLAGDIGFKVKKFEYITSEGIYFLASGINSGKSDNKVLIFEHNISKNTLSWDFKLLSDFE